MSQQSYWNKVSGTKEFTTLLEVEKLKKHLNPDARIIDYGCGYGRTLDTLWQHGFKNTIGYDFSEGMIRRGRQTFPHLNLNVSKNNAIPADNFNERDSPVPMFCDAHVYFVSRKRKGLFPVKKTGQIEGCSLFGKQDGCNIQ